jgi:LAS superfamily LD-carboxypeptidase LdcB
MSNEIIPNRENLPENLPQVESFGVEETDVQEKNEDLNEKEKENKFIFNPVQLTRLVDPTISVTKIEVETSRRTPKEKKSFLTGMGQGPFVYYNGIHIEYDDISDFKLYHENILPAMKINFFDRNGIFKDEGFPMDDTIITVFLYARSNRLRSIKMDFKVTQFQDLDNGKYIISGIVDISKIYLKKFESFSNKTSFECLMELAKNCDIGFCSNVSNSDDKMTWINPGKSRYDFINEVIYNSYISDDSFLFCYIDFFYNICYVDIEKEMKRDNNQDQMIISDGKEKDLSSTPDDDEKIGPIILSTDKSLKETNGYIEDYKVINKSTQISLSKGYSTRTKYYDSLNKQILKFDIDTITSDSKTTIPLKGKPLDNNFFKENVDARWVGKIEVFGDGEGNAHTNFNYSLIQNEINLKELTKIQLEAKLKNPNFNLFITQKVYVSLTKQKPGIAHSSLNYKRLDGNWIITNIEYIFDGKSQYQKVTLVKRELEMDENEIDNQSGLSTENANNTSQNYQNELSPFDEQPNNPSEPQEIERNTNIPPLDTNNLNLDYIVGHTMKDNSGVLRTLVVIDGNAVDEKVAIAFLAMQEAAKKEGVKIQINSGFRPAFGPNFKGKTSKGKNVNITTQETLRRDKSRWIMSERAKFQSDEDFVFKARSSAYNPQTAAPGSSNHGNGIALDLNTGSRISFSPKPNLKKDIYIWLIRNSWKFGFVRAVKSEEWHFEYRPDIANKGPYALFSGGDTNLFYSDLSLDNIRLV